KKSSRKTEEFEKLFLEDLEETDCKHVSVYQFTASPRGRKQCWLALQHWEIEQMELQKAQQANLIEQREQEKKQEEEIEMIKIRQEQFKEELEKFTKERLVRFMWFHLYDTKLLRMDEERRTFEEKEAKERKRVEALQCRAATTIEKQIRAHLVYKKYAPILKEKRKGRKREKELELKREAESRQEEAAKLRREEERRKLEFEKEKEAEREKLEKKRQLKKQQEEEKRKKEEELQRKKKEEQRREEERKLAEERRKREEERKLLEDRRKREEEQKLVEDRRKRGEEQKLAEERKKREEEIKLAEERKKREEEIKLAEERKKREEERKLAEERKKREEEIKLTEERMKSKEKQKEKMSFEKKKELRLNQEGSIIVNKVRNKEIEQNLSLSENLSVVLHQSECEHMPQDFNKPRAFSKDKETAVQNATKLATDTNLEMELPTEDTVKNITEKNDRCKVTIMPTKSSGFVQVTNPRVFTDCLPRRETCETKPVLNTEHINCRNEGSFELTQSIAHKLEMKSRVRALTLPDHIEQKRLNWMKTCTPWSKVSRGNKMKIVKQRIRPHKSSASQLLALNPGLILHSGSWTSLQQVTTVTFCDLPGCNLSTLSQCPSLKSLTLRNCRLETLEGISQCKGLKYIDAQENNLQNIHCHDLEDLCILLLSNNHITSMHGLENCSNLQVLELSHNQITRIGGTFGCASSLLLVYSDLTTSMVNSSFLSPPCGLESLNKLQRLLVDHNQLISTKGLSETPVLLYLDCSYNHLNRIEGIDNCGLLQNLKLQSNSLSEPPRLENHVLLRELWLGDNSISSLQTLSNCWLPMLQHLSVFQNSFLSCLNGCHSLLQLILERNPFQQELGWRCSVLKMLPGLKVVDGERISSADQSPLDRTSMPSPGSFLAFCQAKLQSFELLLRRHETEQGGLDPLEVVNIRCQHCEELMQLAEECRYAHEFGDLTIAEEKEYSNIHHKGNLSVRNQHKKPATGHANKNSPDTDSQIVSNQVQTSVTHSSESRKESDHSHIMCQDSKHSKDPRVLLNEEGTVTSPEDCRISNDQVHSKHNGKAPGPQTKERLAHWRGYLLRKKLSHALATVQAEEEDYNFEEVNLSEFSFDEVSLLQRIRPQNLLLIFRLINKNSARRNHSLYSTLYFVSKACFPTFTDILFFSVAHRGFKNTQTAQLMLKRAQKMKSKKAQGKKLLGMFTFPPVTWQSSNKLVSHKGELTDSKPASPDRLRRSRELTYQWLHTQVVDYETTSSRIMKNHHFLPELGPEILNGGRVQLVASPVGREEPDLEVGSVSSGSSIIQLGDGLNQSRLNSTGSASKFRFCMCFFSKL
uniref:Leucine rich repeats and IQ motif containing 1 n=1 Tax=Callorhinchus milii TaxID=7868 RepID=A0A4W3GHB4_CALMI